MDIVTHAATGLLLSTAFDDPTAKTLCIVGSVIPDIAVIPIYADAIWKTRSLSKAIQMIHNSNGPNSEVPEVFFTVYRGFHSVLPIGIISLLALFLADPLAIAFCLGYLSHLVWDIPTHTQRYACRPLYPLSDYTWSGFGDWWKGYSGLIGMLVSWTVLLGGYFYVS